MCSKDPHMRKIESMGDDPLVPALLTKIYTDGPKDLMDTKQPEAYKERLLDYLHELTESQISRGLMKEGDDVSAFRELSYRRAADSENLQDGGGGGESRSWEMPHPPVDAVLA
jgi:hypothetical protein